MLKWPEGPLLLCLRESPCACACVSTCPVNSRRCLGRSKKGAVNNEGNLAGGETPPRARGTEPA